MGLKGWFLNLNVLAKNSLRHKGLVPFPYFFPVIFFGCVRGGGKGVDE